MKWRVALCVCACVAGGVAARPVLDASTRVGAGDDAYTTQPATVVTTTSSSGATESSATPPTSAPTLTSTTLFGSPFTVPPIPVLPVPPIPSLPVPTFVPPSTAPESTTSPTTVAPCPPCPAYDYQVLAASTVTNTGPTSVSGGVGLWPGTAVTGFPPGDAIVSTDAAAAQGQLTAAYLEAFARVPTVIGAELGGRTVLGSGTYTALTPFEITGTLILDGPGAYTFQSDSTLVTASGSRVVLVNGARACDVTWVVGSSATLGTGSMFAGNILALASITVTTGVTVQGRALARTGAVTLDSDTFTALFC